MQFGARPLKRAIQRYLEDELADIVLSGELAEGDTILMELVAYRDWETDRKSTRLNSSHITRSRMPSSA